MKAERGRTPGRAGADFTEPVKARLAAEAGYRCSNPACLAPTYAAGSTKSGVGKVGQAAHISSAAEGFARWQPRMDPAVRKSAANGIWLCDVHAREIDIDEHRFTISLLHGWKRRARQRALMSRGVPEGLKPTEPRTMIRHTSWLRNATGATDIHLFVGRFLQDVGAHWVWPDVAHDAVRMTLYELVLNAIKHGGASHLHLRARGFRIDLSYVGADFNPNDLPDMAGNGGKESIIHLRETFGDAISIAYTYNGTVATTRLIDVGGAGPNQPCGARLRDLQGPSLDFRNCEVVHVFMGGLMSFSDITALGGHLEKLASTQRVVLHGLGVPLSEFAMRLPNVTVAPPRT